MLSRSIKLTAILFIVFLVLPVKVGAYLDPGSGSYLIQILVASLAGAGFIIKTQWENIKNIFTGRKEKNDKKDESE